MDAIQLPVRVRASSAAAIAIVVATGWLLMGCGSSATTTVGPSLVKCATTSAAPAEVLPAGGGSSTLSVVALPECTWTASTSSPWITDLTPKSGQGNGEIQFRALPNPVPAGRESDLLINDSVVRLKQAAAPCTFAVTPTSTEVGASGGSVRFVVATAAQCPWTVSSSSSWATVTGPSDRTGPDNVDFII